jgi:RNA polymerase sigma factor (sigma-70 family)
VQRWTGAAAFSDVTTEANVSDDEFTSFVESHGLRLRRVMVAQFGVDVGGDSTDAALGWAWEHRARLLTMDNPGGYLYRVARTQARRSMKHGGSVTLPPEASTVGHHSEAVAAESGLPDLASALRDLPHRQRTAVLMVHAYGWTPQELSEMTGVPAATVRSHLRRGLIALRHALAKGDDR